MATPCFKLLERDEARRARIIQIRDAVAPLLAINYQPHFTDHSVAHSDQLCDLVDELTASLDPERRLSTIESLILYEACYFHDAGLQHGRAGETKAMTVGLTQPPYVGLAWADLTPSTQQRLVRLYHHRISHELVIDAAKATLPVLGVKLSDDDKPGVVAALCLAHCLDTGTEEYDAVTAPQGQLRIPLLAALLRLADILDESQRRSHLHLEAAIDLPIDSRLHWWRHYYVSSVSIEPRAITLWLDFPVERRDQYGELFQDQLPVIEREFRRHASVLASNGLAWHLQARHTAPSQCTSIPMDDALERYAVEQTAAARANRLRNDRHMVVRQLRVARPTLERQFTALRESNAPNAEQITGAVNLAMHLASVGGLRDAWMSLSRELDRLRSDAPTDVWMEATVKLAELLVKDSRFDLAERRLDDVVPHLDARPLSVLFKRRVKALWGAALRDNCQYDRAVPVFRELADSATNPTERESALAEIAELYLLQGELTALRAHMDDAPWS